MSTADFVRFIFHKYLNGGCRKCLRFYIRTPVILPVSPTVSGCGGDHPPYLFGATWPDIFATSFRKKKNAPVGDPRLNSFFKLCSKVPIPDPDLDQFFAWAIPPSSADLSQGQVSFLFLYPTWQSSQPTTPNLPILASFACREKVLRKCKPCFSKFL